MKATSGNQHVSLFIHLQMIFPKTARSLVSEKPQWKLPSGKELKPLKIHNTVTYSNKTRAHDSQQKVTRGKSAMNNHVTSKAFKLFSTNCAGVVYGKIESLNS